MKAIGNYKKRFFRSDFDIILSDEERNTLKQQRVAMKSLKIGSELSELDKVREFLTEELKDLNLSDKVFYRIELSLMEICINIMRYAYPEEKGDIFFKIWKEQGKVFFEIKDKGIPFDPTQLELPDIKKIIKEKRKGGLGIFLAWSLMDGFSYSRKNNQNVLLMHKKIKKTDRSKSV